MSIPDWIFIGAVLVPMNEDVQGFLDGFKREPDAPKPTYVRVREIPYDAISTVYLDVLDARWKRLGTFRGFISDWKLFEPVKGRTAWDRLLKDDQG